MRRRSAQRPVLTRLSLPLWIGITVLTAAAWGVFAAPVNGQPAEEQELDEQMQRQMQIAERFLGILEKNPRRGTALDRVYGHHVEFGTLDAFMESLRQRTEESPEDGVGWMLLGLFEAHRGADAEAVAALQKAEQLRGADALASYYLGQSLLLLGRPDEAVTALERAIERQPQRADVLEIFQQLGRIHQRAQRAEQALGVWQRLEALFPNDPRVQEQIAATLVEEGEYGQALPRYEKLAELVRDDYRRTTFRIEAAELKIRENRGSEGIADLERVLSDLNPDSWLHRDVRRRIEDVFLRSGNQDGLVDYYERWIATHPEDVDAMARLARFLAASARVPEATQWMEKALKLAPSRTELRKAFIDQLVDEQRYAEASEQYQRLIEAAPGNTDFLRDWGKLVLKNQQLQPDARRAEATRIWNRILEARPQDALTTAQVADLFRQSKMHDEALALYQKAIDLAPNEPQYREYLGEFYHIMKRPEDALATWTSIAEGARHTAENVARLAEIYNSFGYLEPAVEQIAEACRLDSKDFALQLKAADYHTRASKYDEALTLVDVAERLAANSEERQAVVAQRIDVLRSSRRLDGEIERLAAELAQDAGAKAEQWHLLARYYEASSLWADATAAIGTALEKEPQSISALTTAARIAELAGDYARAAELNRELATIDRRSRGDHLMNVARLEVQMGRGEEALAAGRELIVSAPGNTENYEFYSQLCFQLGKADEAVETLRKAVRINPTEPHLIMALGAALAQQLRTDEAIEVYWRAFEKTEDLDDKTSLIMKLTDLYLQMNQFDKLLERLERDRREEEQRRAMTICLAQAHHSSGDYGTARQELESLLSENTRDTNLLQQLSKLCQEGADMEAAIEYQRQLAEVAPGDESEFRLATLLQAQGERDEASEIFVRLMRREEDPSRRLRNLDSLLTQGAYENAIAVIEPLLSEQRDDWELLYREAVAWASLDKHDEALDRFQRILALTVPHDELGVAAAERLKQQQSQARSNNVRGIAATMPERRSPLDMLGMSSQVRYAAGLDAQPYYGRSSATQPVWTPQAYGESRMAAYAWLMRVAQERDKAQQNESASKQLEEKLAEIGALATSADAGRDTVYDWLYIEQLRGNSRSIYEAARQLARTGGREEQQFFLRSLPLRDMKRNERVASSRDGKPQLTPLDEQDLKLALECYRALSSGAANQALVASGQILYDTNGQAYMQVGGNWVPVAGLVQGGAYTGLIISELRLAGQHEQADQLFEEQLEAASTSQQLAAAMSVLIEENKLERAEQYLPKWVDAARAEIARSATPAAGPRRSSAAADPLGSASQVLMTWIGLLGPEEEHDKVLAILDGVLEIANDAALQQRTQQRNRRARTSSSTGSYGYSRSYSIKYGKEDVRVQVDYPNPNEHLPQAAVLLLRSAYEVFRRNEVPEQLATHLEHRLQQAADDKKLYATLHMAALRWWMDEKDETLALLKRAAEGLDDDPTMQFEMVMLHQSMGEFEDALDMVEAIVPRDQRLVQQREIMALQLAERLGDIGRARQAAERLFGLRLDSDTQLGLVEQMRRLGMHELAESVVARVQRRSNNSVSQMGALMMLYQGQGKTDLAQQLAHSILRRTQSNSTSVAMAMRSGLGMGSSQEHAMRTQAIRLLQQSGGLKDVIARLEQQLERSPNSSRLYSELIECYEATNERDKVAQLLTAAVAQQPDQSYLRYRLANQLEAARKSSEACDQYLEILRRDPQLLSDVLGQVYSTFRQAGRSDELLKELASMNLRSLRQPYYVIDLVATMLRGDQQASQQQVDLAVTITEKAFEAYPEYRSQLLSRMYEADVWKNDRVFRLGTRAIIPSADDVAGNPWFGLHEVMGYSSNGQVHAQFTRVLMGVQKAGRVAELVDIVNKGLAQSPGWLGGDAMLGLIDLKEGRRQEGKQRLEKLLSDEARRTTMPAETGWILGQELEQFEDSRALALTLYESAARSSTRTSQVQYSPVNRLVGLYHAMGRTSEARELLLETMSRSDYGMWDRSYAAYQRIEDLMWAAKQFEKIECHIDAVRIYRDLTGLSQEAEEAGQWNRSDPGYYKKGIEQGLQAALAEIDVSHADEVQQQLLTVAERMRPGGAALDLMLVVPDIDQLRSKSLDSSLLGMLRAIAKQDAIVASVRKRLEELRGQYPGDLSVLITEALFVLDTDPASAQPVLQSLRAAVSDQPLEPLREGRRANSRQQREARTQMGLWLVARECLSSDQHRALGEQLAQRAVEAARRQTGEQHVAAILWAWGQLALAQGDRHLAEAKWSELLEIVTRRPERTEKDAGATGSTDARRNTGPRAVLVSQREAKPQSVRRPPAARREELAKDDPVKLVAPLTRQQFDLTLQIARAAAENGMAELSRRAVRESIRGGVPLPESAQLAQLRPRVIRRNPTSMTSSDEDAVGQALRDVVLRWEGDAYPAREVYDLLVEIVLPGNRPTEIMLYLDSSNLADAQVHSLGELLVQWAVEAERLDDLASRIAARKRDPLAKIAGLVLETHIALAKKDVEAARPPLAELAEQLQQGAAAPWIQLACHAALPAASHEPLKEPAYTILRSAVQAQLQALSETGGGQFRLGRLTTMVNRHLSSDPVALEKFFEDYILKRQAEYSRYSGTYGQYLMWRDWAALADEAAKAGVFSVAFDYMGRVADFSYENYSRPSTTVAMAVVSQDLKRRSAQDRFNAWKDWTLPTGGRQSVRLVAEWIEPSRAPAMFLPANTSTDGLDELLCNFLQLIEAARECECLPQLRELVQPAFEQNLENAAVLYALILVELGDLEAGRQVIDPLLDSLDERYKPVSGQRRPDGWGDYLVFRSCLASPVFAPHYAQRYRDVQRALRSASNSGMLGRLVVDYAQHAARQSEITIRPGEDPGWAYWFPVRHSSYGPDPWWVAQEGHIAHVTGASTDVLYFAYPVTGDFAFSVDAYFGSWAEADAGYGGVLVEAQGSGGAVVVNSLGTHETIRRQQSLRGQYESFGTITIRVKDGRMFHQLNGFTVYEEPLSGTSPWITLFTAAQRETTFRNPRFHGNVTIPREVQLVQGDRMDGWNTSHFSESQPRHRLMAERAKDENDSVSYYQRQEPSEFAWRAKDGQLVGRPSENAALTQSWAYYDRPLQDGETFSYEFYYVPGTKVAHPTIGRIALLLESDGVHEHWITRPDWDEPVFGILDENKQINADARRGPDLLPLRSGDWNQIQLTLVAGTVHLRLNNELIYERTLDAQVERRFGLYRPASQGLEVRAAKLSGPWPESLGPRNADDLVASSRQYTDADRRLINDILQERFFARDATDLVQRARQLSPAEAYDLLAAWVLPSPDHAHARFYFELAGDERTGQQALLCPLLELVSAAAASGRLDELVTAAQQLDIADEQNARARSALLALVAMHGGDFDVARAHLATLFPLVTRGFPKSMSLEDRSIELVVAWQAAEHAPLHLAAFDLADALLDKQRNESHSAQDGRWGRPVDVLMGHVMRKMLQDEAQRDDARLTQWSNVPYYKAELRAAGVRHSDWLYRPGVVQHIPGGTWGQLFFQSPLAGNFEIRAERAMHGWREVAIAYGMHAAEPRYDYKATRVRTVMHGSRDLDGQLTLPGQGNWTAEVRVVVEGNTITTFVNDVQLHRETLPGPPDPWLVLQAANPGNASTVRNLQILGSPTIPDEIDLIDIAGWAGWRADMYGEWFNVDESATNVPWKRADQEIQGKLREDITADKAPSLLMYQRPMLEDGVIEFESYYAPGEFEVHPAVGRTALLVSPKGVARHELTDAQYDTSADRNYRTAIDGAACQVPLKENEWNRFRLELKGQQLTLAINGDDVATVMLDQPPNERHFGLFRYADRHMCRVRKLVYRGEWPKSLPPVEHQQLARPHADSAPDSEPAGRPEPLEFAFEETAEQLRARGLQAEGGVDGIAQAARGTRMLLKDSQGHQSWPRFHLFKPIEGDCILTLDFEDLQFVSPKEGWGSTFSLQVTLDDGRDTWFEVGIGMSNQGEQHFKAARRHKTLADQDRYDGRFLPTQAESGRLRIVRSGALLATYFAEAGSEQFRLFEVWPVSTAPIKSVVVQSANSDAASVIDVVLRRLTIESSAPPKNASAVP